MWTDAVLVAIVTVLGAILVELIRTRRKASSAADSSAKIMHEVTPNSGQSMRDAIGRIERSIDDVRVSIREIREGHLRHAERIAAIEARVCCPPGRRRGA